MSIKLVNWMQFAPVSSWLLLYSRPGLVRHWLAPAVPCREYWLSLTACIFICRWTGCCSSWSPARWKPSGTWSVSSCSAGSCPATALFLVIGLGWWHSLVCSPCSAPSWLPRRLCRTRPRRSIAATSSIMLGSLRVLFVVDQDLVGLR